MLENSLIQSNFKHFSSPALLVKKRDDTWRFCVDYRELKSLTIRDEFLILIIDYLLDELHGVTIFSKINF